MYQDRDPQSPTYQEYSTTCSHTCRELERRAIQEVEVMARVRLLAEQRAAEEMSTVSGESSEGGQNRSSGSQQQSRSSRQWRSSHRRSLIEHPPLYHIHLEDTVMLTVEEEGERMGAPHLVPNRLRDGVRGHINPTRQ